MAPSAVPINGTQHTSAPSKTSTPHPLAPLSADEIISVTSIIRSQWPEGTDLHFKLVTLEEPPKRELIPFLQAEHRGEHRPPPDRKALSSYYIRRTDKFHEAVVNLSEQKVEYNIRLGKNVHGAGDAAEIVEVEKVLLADEGVKAAIEKLQLPEGTHVVSDPWIYGSDGKDDDERMFQCFMYARAPESKDEPDCNHYALPLPFSPVVDGLDKKVIRIDWVPTGKDETPREPGPMKLYPTNEYVPEKQSLRSDLKPLQVVQPEGTSFEVKEEGTSRVIEWQKWHFRLGFNHREGMVIYDVRYDNRQLFHRLSLSDMNIPYADPRHPFHKKSAFDLGDVGAGLMANDLQLGCDCLGSIYYLSATLSDDKGQPLDMPNVVCIHEQDAGIGWKHVNYRTGRAAVTRSRELVLQTILTVSNYEYILSFNFNQAAELHYEVRATGILSTQPIEEGVSVPWGTVVHPGVLATHHQHMFSLRIDPAIDGYENRLVYTEAHPLPRDAKLNPHGTGYVSEETLITESGGFDTKPEANRVFKIVNATAAKNPINGAMPAYKIVLPPFQKILSDKDSFNYRRAEFADQAIYAVAHRDGELYAGGRYTNQSRGGDGVRSWASRKDKLVDQDLVVFAQFGINHIPRIEDFPVMPCEVLRLALKPVNFFEKNPALDVPPSTQIFNRSTLVSERHRQSSAEGTVNGHGHLNGRHGIATNGVMNGNGCCS